MNAAEASSLRAWPVDPLIKVFPDAERGTPGIAMADVARGEHATFQIVVRSEEALRLQAQASSFTREGGSETLVPRQPRFVGYVPVDRPTQKPSRDQLRPPPAPYPDPLLEVDFLSLGANQAQPVWVTLHVPTNAVPGIYSGVLTVEGSPAGRQEMRIRQELKVQVHQAVAESAGLWVTEWFAPHARHMEIAPERDSEEFYGLLRRYARNMAEHRHNVALISPLNLAAFTAGADGRLAIDFSGFDRWVGVFQAEGVIGRIEGGHIGGRKGGWESDFVVTVHAVQGDRVVRSQADPASAEADAFYAQFFPALVSHLKAKGWLGIYMQHLADEPIAQNVGTYRAMAALARKYAPELRIIEACHTKDLTGSIDIWVPQLNFLHTDFAHYRARQKAGNEVWFYTCVFPQGEYANRFLEQPLIKTRLLHWINFRYGATGYLHWGYNQWTSDSPFTHTTRPHGGPPYLPAGDPWIVYPGTDGPLDSIRFEAMRDGIADYALLEALAERDAAAARVLAARIVLDFDKYETDVPNFRAARRELLDRLDRQ
ncbi:MAG: glycoside hydrolase domain-containing protein [Verrucomicrobiia bacterium]